MHTRNNGSASFLLTNARYTYMYFYEQEIAKQFKPTCLRQSSVTVCAGAYQHRYNYTTLVLPVQREKGTFVSGCTT